MEEKIYNKLVRDKIPEIIKADKCESVIKILTEEEYIKELNIKLQEEMKEYLEDNNIDELADLVEVIYGILDYNKVSIEDFEKIRLKKVEKRGAFKERIFLEKTIKNKD